MADKVAYEIEVVSRPYPWNGPMLIVHRHHWNGYEPSPDLVTLIRVKAVNRDDAIARALYGLTTGKYQHVGNVFTIS